MNIGLQYLYYLFEYKYAYIINLVTIFNSPVYFKKILICIYAVNMTTLTLAVSFALVVSVILMISAVRYYKQRLYEEYMLVSVWNIDLSQLQAANNVISRVSEAKIWHNTNIINYNFQMSF